jgi:hypothetical protein
LREEIPYFFKYAFFVGRVFDGQYVTELFENPALLFIQLLRHLHVNVDVKIAATSAVYLRYAEILQSEVRTGLRPFRYLDGLRSVERFDGDFGAQGSLRDVDRQRAM